MQSNSAFVLIPTAAPWQKGEPYETPNQAASRPVRSHAESVKQVLCEGQKKEEMPLGLVG